MRALIVDDSAPMRKLLGMMLRKLGFEPVEAGTAAEALAQLHVPGAITVALVDWGMPGVNGIDLIKKVRAQAQHQDLKIIMTTAVNELDHSAYAYAAGANEYLMKPLTPAALRAKLENLGLLHPASLAPEGRR